MLKIGDFSKFSRVSIKTLRYYDEIGLLKPVKVDRVSGYRYYSADQLPRLNRIVGLKELGLSLEEIGHLLKDNPPIETVIVLLQSKHQEALERLREDEMRLKKMEEWLKRMEKERSMPDNDVVLKRVEGQIVVSLRDVIPTYGDIYRLFDELCSYLAGQRVQYAGPPLAIYYDQEYREKDVDVELAVPVAGEIPTTSRIRIRRLPPIEQAACLIYKGAYEKINQAYSTLVSWVEANGYQINGPDREVYLKGPGEGTEDDPAGYITELQLPVKK